MVIEYFFCARPGARRFYVCYYLGINTLSNLSARRWCGESSFGEMDEYTEAALAEKLVFEIQGNRGIL